MIKWNCSSCGDQLEVDDALAGRKSKCPACQTINDVPYPDFFAFACPGCGRELEVSQDSLGKMIKCPHCGRSTFTPSKQGTTTGTGCFALSSMIAFVVVGGTLLTLVLSR